MHTAAADTGFDTRAGHATRRELAAVAAILTAAAVLRLTDLATRGQFDADQGHDMLVLRSLVRDGVVPLLGPPTSVGAGHHGALYYYLLAPAAALNGGADPLPVVALVALLGIVAVGLTWWLARSIGGSAAGLAAAAVLAVSATAVETSTFLWNPNPIPAASALALVGARLAWLSGRARWWLVAAAGATVAMQCHVLAAVLVPPLAALWAIQLRRVEPGASRRRLVGAGLGALAIVAGGYVPLAVHEVTSGFTETREILAYIAGGGTAAALDAPTRILVALIRTIGWPLAGLVTAAPIPNALAVTSVSAVVAWRLVRSRGDERVMVAWLGGTLAFAGVVLGLLVPGSTVVTPLPVDHYHAFLDPIVATVVGVGVGALVRIARSSGDSSGRTAPPVESVAAAVTAGALVLAIGGWNLATQPAAVSPRGDWGAARAAADRILATAGTDRAVALLSAPEFKSTDAYGYPMTVRGHAPDDPAVAAVVAVVCEDLFEPDCGGPAEARALAAAGGADRFAVVDRFSAAPGRTITVYERRGP